MTKKLSSLIITLLVCGALMGQSHNLANQYFRDGEYEKAAVLYQKLMENRGGTSDHYFSRYLECLLAMDDFEEAEDLVRQQIKRRPQDLRNYVHLGNVYEKQGKVEKAQKQYEKAIDKLYDDQIMVNRLATAFSRLNKLELAISTYERGEDITNSNRLFAYQMADLYRRIGDQSKMVEYYLASLHTERIDINTAQKLLSRYLEKDEYGELQAQLYMSIQEYPDELKFLELLEWVFIQQKDYSNALRQAKAIDKRSGGQGIRVYNLATVAANARDYDAALAAFDYLITDIGPASPYYLDARKEKLSVLRRKVMYNKRATTADLAQLQKAYSDFIRDVGKNARSADVLADWAELEALYMNDVDRAIELLNDIIDLPTVNRFVLNNAKLDLGDYYLIKGEIWEATLLYSQVDKEFREDYLGEIARYKNARLSYFNGDFEWAQAQFDILKSATSRLISNDAIDQSVFIMDNLGLDTTAVPLQLYSKAELQAFQNKYDEAFRTLDSIPMRFPGHQLEDDIWYLKAGVFEKRKEWDKAIMMYQNIFEQYPDEIRADNAIFNLAIIYDEYLDKDDKAMELYEKLFIDYSGSILAVEARKRFRKLRGDVVQ
ncbi:MAG: tetratricopeptide repeat protein [Saprospiraceae bacterium]|nr:tetratricopeptide repeat protein [Saprospiraceae bacterium]